jgi:hypothetical protein
VLSAKQTSRLINFSGHEWPVFTLRETDFASIQLSAPASCARRPRAEPSITSVPVSMIAPASSVASTEVSS